MRLDFENYDVEADARRVRFSVRLQLRNALFREAATTECAFP